ncbi:MAG: cob(I)yrinic acid a,c-diamide adenosyltransferase [Lachnospiraceae bacterium]|nr:cob(I)yrinic acid a,c-diamide adenosyltransferase [Lachnospiraceae bacterium]
MSDYNVQVYFGEGRGKTNAAIGQCIRAISQDQQVIIIQFLKGRDTDALRCLEQFEDNARLFCFEKFERFYKDLSEEEQKDERGHLRNGISYAKKVAEIGECDLLVLDEVLGMVDLGIITREDLEQIIATCRGNCSLVMTGMKCPEEILPLADIATRFCAVEV